MPGYSISQIKEAYAQKREWEKQFPVSYFIFRPASFYVAFLLLKITHSPSKVAWTGFAIGLVGCLSFLFAGRVTLWLGVILLALSALSDAVDGNIARVTKSVTYYGKFLDGILGLLVEASCFWCLGIGLGLNPGSSYTALPFLFPGLVPGPAAFICGAAVTMFLLYANIIEGSYDRFLIEKEKVEGTFSRDINAPIRSSTYRGRWDHFFYVNLHAFNLQILLLAASVLLGAVDVFLYLFVLYYAVRLVVVLAFFHGQAHAKLSGAG